MIIQHNIMALNSYRQLNGNNNALSKNLEKLSSGYKVNRAGDDAAGLAISEKMRAQIKGLETASKNALDGISVIQTAEGSLTETHSMLNRMVELCTQAANGIYSKEERDNIKAEIDTLNAEIDRIAGHTDFNGTKLLNGDLAAGIKVKGTDGTTGAAGGSAGTGIIPTTVNGTPGTDVAGTYTCVIDVSTFTSGDTLKIGSQGTMTQDAGGDVITDATVKSALEDEYGTLYTVSFESATNTYTFTAKTAGAASTTLDTPPKDADLVTNISGAAGTITVTDLGTDADAVATAAKTTIDFGTKTGADLMGAVVDIGGTKYEFGTAGTSTTNTLVTITAGDNATALATALQGAMSAIANFTTAASGSQVTITETAPAGTTAAVAASVTGGGVTAGTPTAASLELDMTGKTGADLIGATIKIGGTTYEIVETGKAAQGTNTAISVNLTDNDNDVANAIQSVIQSDSGLTAFTGTVTGGKITFAETAQTPTGTLKAPVVTVEGGGGLILQIGDTAPQRVSVVVNDMSAGALKTDTVDVSDVNKANTSIQVVKDAIATVSTQRAKLGALQNRLEHTINNLGVTTENITAAESRIRDTDMAKEMMAYTKNSILVQAAQAMLAQANQVPQGILQLLR